MTTQYGVFPPTGGSSALTQSQFDNTTDATHPVPMTVTGGIVKAALPLSAVAAGASQAKITLSSQTDGLLGILATGNLSEATSSILTITGGTGVQVGGATTIQVKQAATGQSGYLSSTDWNTFNNKEGAIAAGSTSQYWRGDKSWQTLNQASVAGLTTTDSPTFAGATIGSGSGLAKLASGAVSALSGTSAQYVRADGTVQTLTQNAVAGVTTSDSPTFAALALSGTAGAGYAELAQQSAAPTSPAAGKDRLYVDSSDRAHLLTSGGVDRVFATEASQRNFLINGNFTINQRGGAPYTASTVYTLDRWALFHNYTSANVTQQQLTAIQGTYYCVRLTNTTRGTGSFFDLVQPIETQSTIQMLGLPVTLSFWARKSSGLVAGQLAYAISSTTTVDDSALNVVNGTAVGGAQTITAASLSTSFQFYSFTTTMPVSVRTSGVYFNLNNSPTDGQYIEITNAMLSIGGPPSAFQMAGANFQQELSMCQRYYERIGIGMMGAWGSSTSCTVGGRWAVPKRRVPDIALLTTTPTVVQIGIAARTGSGSTINLIGASDVRGFEADITGFTGATAQNGAAVQTADMFEGNAEL